MDLTIKDTTENSNGFMIYEKFSFKYLIYMWVRNVVYYLDHYNNLVTSIESDKLSKNHFHETEIVKSVKFDLICSVTPYVTLFEGGPTLDLSVDVVLKWQKLKQCSLSTQDSRFYSLISVGASREGFIGQKF